MGKKYKSLLEFAVLGRADEKIDLKTLVATRKKSVKKSVQSTDNKKIQETERS